MIISTGPRPGVPRRLDIRPITESVSPPRASGLVATTHPQVFGFSLQSSLPTPTEQERALAALRLVCGSIANHLGGKVRLANSMIWLSLDAAAFWDEAQDPSQPAAEKFARGLGLTAGLVDCLAQTPRGAGLAPAVLPLYFAADLGDRIATGRCEVSAADLADYAEDPTAAWLKLPQLLQPSAPRSAQLSSS